jgi:hypothetical protein
MIEIKEINIACIINVGLIVTIYFYGYLHIATTLHSGRDKGLPYPSLTYPIHSEPIPHNEGGKREREVRERLEQPATLDFELLKRARSGVETKVHKMNKNEFTIKILILIFVLKRSIF